MLEFALRFANDHWMVPFQLDLGTLCRIDNLVITDTFGQTIIVRPVAAVDGPTGPFRLFEHAVSSGQSGSARDPLFALVPTLDHVLTAPRAGGRPIPS